MHFNTKSYLKSNWNHTTKQTFKSTAQAKTNRIYIEACKAKIS